MQPDHDDQGSDSNGEDELVIEDISTTTDTDSSEDSDGDYQPEDLRRSQRQRGPHSRGPFGAGHRHDHANDFRADFLNRFSDKYHQFKRSLNEDMGRRRNCGGPPVGRCRGLMNHHREPMGHLQRGPHSHCRPMNYHHHQNRVKFGGHLNHPGGHWQWHHGPRRSHGNSAEHPGQCGFRKDHSRPHCQKRKKAPAREPVNHRQRNCCCHNAGR